MATHVIKATPETVHWGHFDAALPAVIEIDPDDVVVVETVSGGEIALPPEGNALIRPEHRAIQLALEPDLGPHILTGPIKVRGAEPGDALRVEILEISLADTWGYNLIHPEKGVLPGLCTQESHVHFAIDRSRALIKTPWGIDIPARPFFGTIGAAPTGGRCSSIPPGEFGGNMDNKELVAGSVLYLPVAVAGGILSIGDGHAAQGDGESCLTAVETGLTGHFKIGLMKASNLSAPYAETPTHLITMAFEDDLDTACQNALRRMIEMLCARTGLSSEQAYRLCSVAVDLRITQAVNIRKGVHAMLPRQILDQLSSSPLASSTNSRIQ